MTASRFNKDNAVRAGGNGSDCRDAISPGAPWRGGSWKMPACTGQSCGACSLAKILIELEEDLPAECDLFAFYVFAGDDGAAIRQRWCTTRITMAVGYRRHRRPTSAEDAQLSVYRCGGPIPIGRLRGSALCVTGRITSTRTRDPSAALRGAMYTLTSTTISVGCWRPATTRTPTAVDGRADVGAADVGGARSVSGG